MTDYVSIRDLSVAAVIGVHPWEREIEQTLIVSVDMIPETADVRKAAATDDLVDALDYSAVADTIAGVLREGKFRLIEAAAERVAGCLLADFPLSWLRLELRKPIVGAPSASAVPRSSVTSVPRAAAAPEVGHASDVGSATTAPVRGTSLTYTAAVTIERTHEVS
jgi:7,8-dihydroneopterin aldolase/epimerase/oxygenase